MLLEERPAELSDSDTTEENRERSKYAQGAEAWEVENELAAGTCRFSLPKEVQL